MQNKIKEQLHIEVNETEVKEDIVIELNTLSENSSEVTQKIEGKLKAIILDVNKNTKIEVFFTEFPEIMILDIIDYKAGSRYYIPKTNAFNCKGELFNFSSDHWLLCDNITFRITGSNDTKVKFILRTE